MTPKNNVMYIQYFIRVRLSMEKIPLCNDLLMKYLILYDMIFIFYFYFNPKQKRTNLLGHFSTILVTNKGINIPKDKFII